MKDTLFFLVLPWFFAIAACPKAAAGSPDFDRIYDEIAEADKKGTLEEYISTPVPDLTEPQVPDPAEPPRRLRRSEPPPPPDTIDFTRKELPEVPEKPWHDVVLAAKNGTLTAFDFKVIRERATSGDLGGMELLAFLYAKGQGVRQDLPKAWHLYMKAAQQGLKGAEDNAKAVYKSMSPAQRKSLTPF